MINLFVDLIEVFVENFTQRMVCYHQVQLHEIVRTNCSVEDVKGCIKAMENMYLIMLKYVKDVIEKNEM